MTLPVLASDPDLIQRAADPAQFVVLACERAKEWLAQALEHGDIEQIVELKSQAEAIRVYTAQKQIGKDAELAASEIVRRAERGIGIAIRRGQEAGEIRRHGQGGGAPGLPRRDTTLSKPTDFATHHELCSNGAGIYHLTDGVSDEQFETALDEAKAETNLSRANVVRKVRAQDPHLTADIRIAELAGQGYSSRQIAERIGVRDDRVREIAKLHSIDIPADVVIGKTRRHDSNRIVRETVSAMEGLAIGAGLVDVAELDPAQLHEWAGSLTNSIRVLNRLTKQMKEATQ